MCTKVVVSNEFGVKHKRKCNKSEYKDGLCKHHYDKLKNRLTNWDCRKNYRNATQNDLDIGRSLKLKGTNSNTLYQCQNGKMKVWNSKQNKYILCDMPSYFDLFCVLDY